MKDLLSDSASYEPSLDKPAKVEDSLPAIVQIKLRLASLTFKFTPLFTEIKDFARWLEVQALPLIDYQNKSSLQLKIGKDGRFSSTTLEPEHLDKLAGFYQTGSFFRDIGISQLEFSPRLGANQIEDLMTFLHVHRQEIMYPDRSGHGIKGLLHSPTGFIFSCMNIQIHRGALKVAYRYCLTRFSRFVFWFEQRNRTFSDHRALFNAAPRYGLLAGIITLIPLVIYLANGSRDLLIIISILAAASLFGLMYSFFMVIGSLEYDNEEKAYRLGRANQELRKNALKIQRDLQRARTIQEIILPDRTSMPMPGHLEWAFTYVPETEVGGDYFDTIQINPDEVAIIFADVSGHGMQAAFITAIMKSTFLALTENNHPLEQLLFQLNRRLVSLTPQESFAAVFIGIYNRPRGEFRYINGGHSPLPILLPGDRAREPVELTEAPGMILGIMEDLEITPSTLPVQPGDKILMVTDGIVEALNEDGLMFGEERLNRLIRQNRGLSVVNLVQKLLTDLKNFTGDIEQDDDQTVLAFEVVKPAF